MSLFNNELLFSNCLIFNAVLQAQAQARSMTGPAENKNCLQHQLAEKPENLLKTCFRFLLLCRPVTPKITSFLTSQSSLIELKNPTNDETKHALLCATVVLRHLD